MAKRHAMAAAAVSRSDLKSQRSSPLAGAAPLQPAGHRLVGQKGVYRRRLMHEAWPSRHPGMVLHLQVAAASKCSSTSTHLLLSHHGTTSSIQGSSNPTDAEQ